MFSNPIRIFTPLAYSVRTTYGISRVGDRDIVGHGSNGLLVYKDDAHFPFPAVRFAENTPYIRALRIKEKGDWRMICCEEKKMIYRASFCQTFAEFQAITGSWKFTMGWVLVFISGAFWIEMWNHFYVNEPLPATLEAKKQMKQLRRILNSRTNPIDGISALWNHDDDNWKATPSQLKQELQIGTMDDKPA